MTSLTIVSHFGVAVQLLDEQGKRFLSPVQRKSGYVVGDQVLLEDNKLKRLPRKNELARKTHFDPKQILAANLDVVGVLVAAEPRMPGQLLDHLLVAIRKEKITPIIIVNKADLDSSKALFDELKQSYQAQLQLFLTSTKSHEGIDALRQYLETHGRTILVGVSGAGKSSLTNALLPEANLPIGVISDEATHGQHKTSTSTLHQLPGGGELIDTPGVRDFKPIDVDPLDLATYFVGFGDALDAPCRFRDCLHRTEPGCVIREGVAEGKIDPKRYQMYLDLLSLN